MLHVWLTLRVRGLCQIDAVSVKVSNYSQEFECSRSFEFGFVHFIIMLMPSSCTEDCQCVYGATSVGFDASFIFLLVRSCAGAHLGPSELLHWLSKFSCEGRRQVLTSLTCRDECCDGTNPIQDILADLNVEDVWKLITPMSTDEMTLFDSPVSVDGRSLPLDDGENSLLTLLEDFEDPSVIVIEDDDAFDVVNALVIADRSRTLPAYSTYFLREMYMCSMLTRDEVAFVCDGIYDSIERLVNMSEKKARRKKVTVDQFLDALGAKAAIDERDNPS